MSLNIATRSLMSAAALACTGQVAAQVSAEPTPQPETEVDAQPGALDDIIVTARRRSESLQSVPVAVSAITPQMLQNNLTTDMAKLGELAPQLTLATTGSGTGAIISIRGVASGAGDPGLDQSVAIDLDGVPLSRGRVLAAPLFDLAAVQVLQGPQALFFGKNSPAGVISVRSQDPTNTFEAYITAGYEFNANERFVEAMVSGPVSDTLKMRLAVRGSKLRGWLKNVAEPTQSILDPSITTPGATQGDWGPQTRDLAGRLTMIWEPIDDFDAKLKVAIFDRTRNGDQLEPFCINGVTIPTELGVPISGADCKKDRVRASGAVPRQFIANTKYARDGEPYLDDKFIFGALTLNKEFSAANLVSTTGFYRQTSQGLSNLDNSPSAAIWVAQRERYTLFTQEVRLNTDFDGPIQLSGGAYYEHSFRRFHNAAQIFTGLDPVSGNYVANTLSTSATDDYISAFAQARWNILPTLELAGGARWSRDKKSSNVENLSVNPAFATSLLPVGAVVRGRYSDDHISPEATLTWHPTPAQTLYTAFKTGYKAGGLSNQFLPPINTTPESLVFKPETTRGFEVGYKATMFDRRLRFDLTAYRYDYLNLQVVTNVPPTDIRLANAGKSRIQGFQGSFEMAVKTDVTLRGNFGYNSAKYRDYREALCYSRQTVAEGCSGGFQNLTGENLYLAPKMKFSVGGEYRPELISGWNTALSSEASHSSSYNAATDKAPGGRQSPYWLLNAAVRVSPESEKFEVALVGRNLTNTYYLQFANVWTGGGPDQYQGDFNRPREIVLQATFRW